MDVNLKFSCCTLYVLRMYLYQLSNPRSAPCTKVSAQCPPGSRSRVLSCPPLGIIMPYYSAPELAQHQRVCAILFSFSFSF